LSGADNVFIADDYRPGTEEVFRELPGLEPAGRFEVLDPGDRSIILSHNELTALLAEKYNLGLREGRAGKEQFRQDTVRNLLSVIRRADESVRAVVNDIEMEVIKLSMEIAGRIIRKEIETDVEGVLAEQVRTCMNQIEDGLPVLMRINPMDKQAAESIIGESEVQLPERFRLVEDNTIQRGGCIMGMDSGSLRALISEQLEKIEEVLRAEYERSTEE